MVKSDTTGALYDPSKCCRIVNMTQLAFYALDGVKILEFYPSTDYKTGKPIMVGVVNREDSYESYKKWCDNKPN